MLMQWHPFTIFNPDPKLKLGHEFEYAYTILGLHHCQCGKSITWHGRIDEPKPKRRAARKKGEE